MLKDIKKEFSSLKPAMYGALKEYEKRRIDKEINSLIISKYIPIYRNPR